MPCSTAGALPTAGPPPRLSPRATKQQATLIELLTPEQKPKKGGPGLDEPLAEMIVRLDQQNYLLKDVSDTVSKAVTILPLSVVKAMADAFPPADEPAATTLRNGYEKGLA